MRASLCTTIKVRGAQASSGTLCPRRTYALSHSLTTQLTRGGHTHSHTSLHTSSQATGIVLVRVEVGDDFPFLAGLTFLSRLPGPQILRGCVLALTRQRRPVCSDQQWQRAQRQHDSTAADAVAHRSRSIACTQSFVQSSIGLRSCPMARMYVWTEGLMISCICICICLPKLITRQCQI